MLCEPCATILKLCGMGSDLTVHFFVLSPTKQEGSRKEGTSKWGGGGERDQQEDQ